MKCYKYLTVDLKPDDNMNQVLEKCGKQGWKFISLMQRIEANRFVPNQQPKVIQQILFEKCYVKFKIFH
jgi:hypothetical protein